MNYILQQHTKALVFITGAFLFSFSWIYGQQKINGVNLVNPPHPTSKKDLATVQRISASWVSIIPYAFVRPEHTTVQFDSGHQWWGESSKGSTVLIQQAQELGLKTMLKPHIWVGGGQGWGGDFTLKKESDWLAWEKSYLNYIITYARIAETHRVDLLCIGTELRQIVKTRPHFWLYLIKEIRKIYSGKLTYAANWDNYENVTFWEELDYIGIDSYFPLSVTKTPNLKGLKIAWRPWKEKLQLFANCYSKKIIFTEYGYQSCLSNTRNPWHSTSKVISEENQDIAYQALYDTFWNENWFIGGFLWKWHLINKYASRRQTAYTPQGKLVEKTILKTYDKK